MPPSVKAIYTGFMSAFSVVGTFESCGNMIFFAATGAGLPLAFLSSAACAASIYNLSKSYGGFKKALSALYGNNAYTNCSVTATLWSGVLTISGNGDLCSSEINKYADRKDEIKALIIGDGVTSIPSGIFQNYINLKEVTIKDSNIKLRFVGSPINFSGSPIETLYLGRDLESAFVGGNYSNGNPFGGNVSLKTLTIGNNVTVINANSFSGCIGLQTINFGDSITTIGDNAFNNDSSIISNLNFPNALTSIGNSAFYNCGMPEVFIPSSVSSIGSGAFQGCANLKEVTIQDGNTKLRFVSSSVNFSGSPVETLYLGRDLESAFVGGNYSNGNPFCSNDSLKTLTIGNYVTAINAYSFSGCTGLQTINFGDSITTIGDNAFNNCSSVTSIINFPNTLTSIGSSAFYNCGMPEVFIPSSVSSIGSGAFQSCANLKKVTIENSDTKLRFVGSSVNFSGSPVETLYLDRDLESAFVGGNYSNGNPFGGNASLKTLTIGNNVTVINANSFSGCIGLTQIISNATTPPTLSSNTFYDVPTNIPVYVPCGSYIDYQNAPYWNSFTNFVDYCAEVVPAENSAVISWTAMADATYYEIIIYTDESHTQVVGRYTVDAAGNATQLRAANSQNELSLLIEGLTASTSYYFTITSYTAENAIVGSLSGDFTTLAENIKSSDATLKSLTVSEGILTPAFDAGITEYTVNVANDVSSITIYATANYSAATVSGNGTKSLNVGDNPFNIVVTAEDGTTTNTYKVLVTRELSTTDAINDIASSSFKIFPNPTKDEIIIQSASPVKKVEIYSLAGVLRLTDSNFSGKISIASLPQGVYMVKVYTDTGLVVSKITKE